MTPSKEKGASDFKFLSQHKGNKMVPVTVHKTAVRLSMGAKAVNESAKTMEKAKQAKKVLMVVDQAGILAVFGLTVRAQASAYDRAPVMAQTSPIHAKPTALRIPITVIKATAGIKADLALPVYKKRSGCQWRKNRDRQQSWVAVAPIHFK